MLGRTAPLPCQAMTVIGESATPCPQCLAIFCAFRRARIDLIAPIDHPHPSKNAPESA